jgi:hypothetical protein
MKIKAMHQAFDDEDGPIIGTVQAEVGDADFFDLLMSNDMGSARVGKLLQKLIAKEGMKGSAGSGLCRTAKLLESKQHAWPQRPRWRQTVPERGHPAPHASRVRWSSNDGWSF